MALCAKMWITILKIFVTKLNKSIIHVIPVKTACPPLEGESRPAFEPGFPPPRE
ncbi:MAG: hypothetical protein US70_C0016G0014 [Parcubacteria group bacterium GW2011_GWD2_38_11]|nr:MAG: hypothetical protein US70_C0016G0014 [Parcubacteria group bacterium GW2011_GWD2_38_11]